jgi:hypothetical protein
MTCQEIIILYMYLIFAFSRSDTFIHWCYFERDGIIRTYFHFFKYQVPYVCRIREMFSVIFLRIVFILFCASSFKKAEIPVFLQVLKLSLCI